MPPEEPPTTFDNPFLAGATVATLQADYEGIDDAAQELHSHFLSLRGAIYKTLGPTRHGREAIERDGGVWPTGPGDADDVIAGQDLGAESPSALVVLAKVAEQWCVVAEVERPAPDEESWHEMIAPVLAHWQPSRIWLDTNYPQTTSAQRKRGLPVKHADKGADSVRDGIREVQRLLGNDGIAFDVDGCERTWREMGNYRWELDRAGEVRLPERPAKTPDHTCDALGYALYMEHDNAPFELLVG